MKMPDLKVPKVQAAFDRLDHKPPALTDYLTDLRATWSSCETTLTRTAFLILTFAAAFVLVHGNGVTQLSFGGVSISKVTIVLAAIPVIIAYLAYVMSQVGATILYLGDIHDRLIREYWHQFATAQLQETLRPPNSVGSARALADCLAETPSVLRKCLRAGGWLRFVVFVFGPLVFDIYALVILWQTPKVPGLELVLAAVLTFLFFTFCIPNLILIVDQFRDAGEDV